MPKKEDYHVLPNPEGGWDVKREGAGRASNHYDTKAPAMDRARDLAQKAHVERVEHRKDGTIRDSDSYENDPNPPKDKVK